MYAFLYLIYFVLCCIYLCLCVVFFKARMQCQKYRNTIYELSKTLEKKIPLMRKERLYTLHVSPHYLLCGEMRR